ncbi:MAG: aldo/keto reductase [Steroidobacteraceae bacterium]|nr:aldo/keto reductase [Steroidobacteraceae bacterium]
MAASPKSLLRAHQPEYAAPVSGAADSTVSLHTGTEMPSLGFGTWQLRHHTAETVFQALEAGYRLIDTSGDYHTQRGIGNAIRGFGGRREDIFLVTKIEETDDAYEATRRNLSELKLDYADLVLIHRPPEGGVGEVLWQELRRAKLDGLARDIGVSNYSIEQIEELVYRTGEMPVVNQVEWTPFGHSPRMLDFCHDNGIVLMAWSPLTRAQRLNDSRLAAMAARYGRTSAQLLIRWNLQQGVVPLPKANHVQHLRDNLHVFDFEIAQPDMARLRAMNEHYSALGSLEYL